MQRCGRRDPPSLAALRLRCARRLRSAGAPRMGIREGGTGIELDAPMGHVAVGPAGVTHSARRHASLHQEGEHVLFPARPKKKK